MRAERMGALSRFAIQTAGNLPYTAAAQWLERSLDDSAVKRIAVPELFLTVDSLLILYHEVARGLEVHEATVRENLQRELPRMATETLLMAASRAGGDRQQLHERIRIRAREAAAGVEGEAGTDLLDRLAAEPGFAELPEETWRRARDPATYVGRAPEQTRRFLAHEVRPRLEAYGGQLQMTDEVRV
jgi:adenylosuccinate lyase